MVNPTKFELAAENLHKLLAIKSEYAIVDTQLNEVIMYLADQAKKFSQPSVQDFFDWVLVVTKDTPVEHLGVMWADSMLCQEEYGQFAVRCSIFEDEVDIRNSYTYEEFDLWEFLFKSLNISEKKIWFRADIDTILDEYGWERFVYALKDFAIEMKEK